MKQPESLEKAMRDLFSILGLPDVAVIETVRTEWDQLSGPPWAGQTRPSYLRDGELVVTVSVASLVPLLRYAIGDLLRRLDARLGEGVVTSVRVMTRSK